MNRLDRERGVLSKADRAYLRDEKEYGNEDTPREIRRRIRERVRNGLADFGLVFERMEKRDREQIIDNLAHRSDQLQAQLEGEGLPDGPPELVWDAINPDEIDGWVPTTGLGSTQSYVLLLFYEAVIENEEFPLSFFETSVEHLVKEGLGNALGKKGIVADINVDISIDEQDVDVEDLRRQFHTDMGTLNDQQVNWLVHLREIDLENMVFYYRYHRDELK